MARAVFPGWRLLRSPVVLLARKSEQTGLALGKLSHDAVPPMVTSRRSDGAGVPQGGWVLVSGAGAVPSRLLGQPHGLGPVRGWARAPAIVCHPGSARLTA